MNAEILIQDDADRFSWILGRREPDAFKDKLTIKLSDYYENLDKLIFLYRVLFNIETKYENHLKDCQFKDDPFQCAENKAYLKSKFYVEQEIRELNPEFEYSILRPNVNSSLIRQNLVQLKDFPNSSKQFLSAIDKLNEGKFERNLLDDLRLSLEYLLKAVLGNQKSLENQLEEIMKFLSEKGTSRELTNMFRILIDYYSKYQNNYVKHNDNIKKDEIDLMVNLTSSFINFIINK
jgi:hypothetical protein